MAKRVGVIEIRQETNTFTKSRTELSDFLASWYFAGQDVLENLRDTNSPIGGCIDVASQLGWELLPIIATHAEPGGTVTAHAIDRIGEDVQSRLRESAPFDALFLSLHGAMVTETAQDGESQILKFVREVVGDIPIAITLDLHANISDEMVGLVDIAVSYRTYPHVDMRQVSEEACTLLGQVLNDEISPKIALARPPMLVGCDDGRTTNNGPMCRILEHAGREMQVPAILNVAVNAGFTDSDVYAAGPSVLVTYDEWRTTEAEALAVANRVCDTIWNFRDEWDRPMDLSDCIERLRSRVPGTKPVVVADFSDNPGGGGYGDCASLLSALIDAGLTDAALGALYDPKAVAELTKAGVGAEVTVIVGGKTDPKVGGGPVELAGTVKAISDGRFIFEGPMNKGVPSSMGPSVCFHTKGIDVLMTSERIQLNDQNLFRAVGIEPIEKSIVAVKSMQHFRGAFAPIADEIFVTDAGGLCTPNVTLRNYENLRRPVFPFDEIDAEHL